VISAFIYIRTFSFHVNFKFTQSHVIIDAEHLPINNHLF